MKICVVGAGYVGLATAVMFGKMGHEVVCADIDPRRVRTVNDGKATFYEPPLEKELASLVKAGRLSASEDVRGAASDSKFIFLCVQTPSLPTGGIDLKALKAASRSVGRALADRDDWKVVVVKSTVVPGTTDTVVKPIIEKSSGKRSPEGFGLCMNPEFLQEGSALKDSLEPSRVVIGAEDDRSGRALRRLYGPISSPKVVTRLRAAEMIKYASNSFLAVKISYANEVANMCHRFGIDSEEVLRAAGMDPRIGPLFLRPGLGFGGSCLPKDVKALRHRARKEGYPAKLLSATLAVNDDQPLEALRLLESSLGSVSGKRIAVLGLAFKGGVDDVRDTRAVPLVTALLSRGAEVVAYDPMAMSAFIELMPTIAYESSAASCIAGADACVVQAEWPEFRSLGRKEISRMRTRLVVDGRRYLDPAKVRAAGAEYLGIGYGSPAPE